MNTRSIILAAVLAAIAATANAEEVREPGTPMPKPTPAPVERQPGTPMPKPRPGTPPTAKRIDFSPAYNYANRGDARTLEQAKAHADAAKQNAAEQVASLRTEAFAGIAQAASLVPMEPNGPGRSTLNVGVASYGGQTAIGLSFARQFNGMTLNAGASKSNNGRTLTRVGFGWNF